MKRNWLLQSVFPCARLPTFWPMSCHRTQQSGNNLPGIFAFMLTFCDPVARHTQRDCSNYQTTPIPPLPAG